jgi:hypothetical protein
MSDGEEDNQRTPMEKAFLESNESRRQRQSTAPKVASHTATPSADPNEHPVLPPFDKAPSQIPQGAEVKVENPGPVPEFPGPVKEEAPKKKHSIFGK